MGAVTMSDVPAKEMCERLGVTKAHWMRARKDGFLDDYIVERGRLVGVLRHDLIADREDELWDVMYNYLRHHAPGSKSPEHCPLWISTDIVVPWMEGQLPRCGGMWGELAAQMGLPERRLWDWRHRARYVSWYILEDALWSYGCYAVEPLLGDEPRKWVLLKRPRATENNRRAR